PARFVQREVDELEAQRYLPVVDLDDVTFGVDPCAELRGDAVDGDPSGSDEVFVGTTRADTGAREHLLEPFFVGRVRHASSATGASSLSIASTALWASARS